MIDYEGIREDLLEMSERADAAYDRAYYRERILGYWRRLEALADFRGACLDEISRLRRENKISR